jgi:A/G-specific adenine glycosylase
MRRVWEIAATLVERGRPEDVNQALMDLGATVCGARRPRCDACPVRRVCASG